MYRKVDYDIWGDEKFRELSQQPPSAQGLWIYLLIGKHTSMLPGVISARPAEIFAFLNWPIDARSLPKGSPEGSPEPYLEPFAEGCLTGTDAMAELIDSSMAEADPKAGLIWLPKGIRRNPPPSPNHLKAWSKEWARVPTCELKLRIWEDWRVFLDGYGEPYGKAFREGFGEPLWEGSQEGSPEGSREPGSRKQEAGTVVLRTPGTSQAAASSKAKAPRRPPKATQLPPEALAVAGYLLDAIRSHNPGHAATDAQVRAWAGDIDLAMRIDKRTPAQLRQVIDSAHRNDRETFWRKNLLSGRKLRKQFDQIFIAAKSSTVSSVKVGSVAAKEIDQYPEVGEEKW